MKTLPLFIALLLSTSCFGGVVPGPVPPTVHTITTTNYVQGTSGVLVWDGTTLYCTNDLGGIVITNIYVQIIVVSNIVAGNIQGPTNTLAMFTPDDFGLGASIAYQTGVDSVTFNGTGTPFIGFGPTNGYYVTMEAAANELTIRGAVKVNEGIITTAMDGLDVVGTWNNGAVLFNGILVNITNTASSASSTLLDLKVGNVNKFVVFSDGSVSSAKGFTIPTSSTYGWALTSTLQSQSDGDLTMANAAGSGFSTLRIGPSSASSPFTATVQTSDGNGTDTAGSGLVLLGGRPTGNAKGGSVIVKTGLSKGSGSALSAPTERYHAIPKAVDLTEGADTLVANISLGTTNSLGVLLYGSVKAGDGTDWQSLSSRVSFDAVNKGGTVTVGTVLQTDNTLAVSTASTLTATYTAVANGNSVDIKVNASSSLTQTTLRCKLVVLAINSDDIATVTEE